MRILRFSVIIIAFIFLTILTQVGGVLYLLSLLTHSYINTKKRKNRVAKLVLKFCSFLLIYSTATFFIVPLLAKGFGRVSLPFTQTENLKPLNFLTCFLNRQYVKPELKTAIMEVAYKMNAKFPGTVVNYLDANFPFINKFPLIPHLSHNDGKKLDIAFCYIDNKTGLSTNKVPSPIGYGISEEPRENEVNAADFCDKKGYWQYSFMMKIIPQASKKNFLFDTTRTKSW